MDILSSIGGIGDILNKSASAGKGMLSDVKGWFSPSIDSDPGDSMIGPPTAQEMLNRGISMSGAGKLALVGIPVLGIGYLFRKKKFGKRGPKINRRK